MNESSSGLNDGDVDNTDNGPTPITIADKILKQFTSGRWLLTMIAGVCLAGMVYTDARLAARGIEVDKLPFNVQVLLTIITAVFMAYFQRDKSKENT